MFALCLKYASVPQLVVAVVHVTRSMPGCDGFTEFNRSEIKKKRGGGIFEFQIHFLFLYLIAQTARPAVLLCNTAWTTAHLHLINIDHSPLPCDTTAALNKYLSVFLLKHVL